MDNDAENDDACDCDGDNAEDDNNEAENANEFLTSRFPFS